MSEKNESTLHRRKRCAGQVLLLLLFLINSLLSCRLEDLGGDDLEAANKAYVERNLTLTERLLERYLREEKNADKRWEAWLLLLKTVNANNQEARVSLEFLDTMLDEYENDQSRLPFILSQMGKYNELLRHYDHAADAWSAYVDLGELGDNERVEGYRHLAAMQFGQRHFEAGEETLQQCLALPLSDHDKIRCMLDLADENMARERWEEVSDLCQQIFDSEPDQTIFGLAGYLRGDALEQMGRKDEALAQFEAVRDSYPNPAVIDNRIKHLEKITGKKKENK